MLTEYFSYLRRDPEPEGYAFRLNVLEKKGGQQSPFNGLRISNFGRVPEAIQLGLDALEPRGREMVSLGRANSRAGAVEKAASGRLHIV